MELLWLFLEMKLGVASEWSWSHAFDKCITTCVLLQCKFIILSFEMWNNIKMKDYYLKLMWICHFGAYYILALFGLMITSGVSHFPIPVEAKHELFKINQFVILNILFCSSWSLVPVGSLTSWMQSCRGLDFLSSRSFQYLLFALAVDEGEISYMYDNYYFQACSFSIVVAS